MTMRSQVLAAVDAMKREALAGAGFSDALSSEEETQMLIEVRPLTRD